MILGVWRVGGGESEGLVPRDVNLLSTNFVVDIMCIVEIGCFFLTILGLLMYILAFYVVIYYRLILSKLSGFLVQIQREF